MGVTGPTTHNLNTDYQHWSMQQLWDYFVHQKDPNHRLSKIVKNNQGRIHPSNIEIIKAVVENNEAQIRIWLTGPEKCYLAPSEKHGWAPIHLSILLKRPAILLLFLNNSYLHIGNIHRILGPNGESPLHLAAELGCLSHEFFWINYGGRIEMRDCNVNARDIFSETPLLYAIRANIRSSIWMLLKYGASTAELSGRTLNHIRNKFLNDPDLPGPGLAELMSVGAVNLSHNLQERLSHNLQERYQSLVESMSVGSGNLSHNLQERLSHNLQERYQSSPPPFSRPHTPAPSSPPYSPVAYEGHLGWLGFRHADPQGRDMSISPLGRDMSISPR